MSLDREFPDHANIYYDPAKCGLEIVASLDERGLSHEFNECHLWRDVATGEFYFAADSGCSCPTPFEGFKSLSAMTHIPNRGVLRDAVNGWAASCFRGKPDTTEIEKFVALYPGMES